MANSFRNLLVRGSMRSWRVLSWRALSCIIVVGTCLGCKESGGDAAGAVAAPAAEPERFKFEVPSNYVPLELRGEGSEALKAPSGARVRTTGGGFSIDGGSDFALDVSAGAPPLAELASNLAAAGRVLEEGDLIIAKTPTGYAFVMIRELVPEWDESERQRFACSSRGARAGGGAAGADQPSFSRSAVQDMVAACRSLELPKLE